MKTTTLHFKREERPLLYYFQLWTDIKGLTSHSHAFKTNLDFHVDGTSRLTGFLSHNP